MFILCYTKSNLPRKKLNIITNSKNISFILLHMANPYHRNSCIAGKAVLERVVVGCLTTGVVLVWATVVVVVVWSLTDVAVVWVMTGVVVLWVSFKIMRHSNKDKNSDSYRQKKPQKSNNNNKNTFHYKPLNWVMIWKK